MTPTARTLDLLRRSGYLAETVEKWLPRVNLRRDLFHFADVLACHPVRREIVLVQCTSIGHVADRLTKARGRPELLTWLRAGGRFIVMGWLRQEVKQVELTAEDLAGIVVQAPAPRRGRNRQRGLFDAPRRPIPADDEFAPAPEAPT